MNSGDVLLSAVKVMCASRFAEFSRGSVKLGPEISCNSEPSFDVEILYKQRFSEYVAGEILANPQSDFTDAPGFPLSAYRERYSLQKSGAVAEYEGRNASSGY